ncbi:hypothetical protein [Halomicrobium salinisoli]|uniref:hypothetical protein n=1 Tax=Halomicrobium salinisoli TaxID=2878391 RepID=UPI001CF0A99E|nr:hypothetical protein [Halomicrobium salinisoli]
MPEITVTEDTKALLDALVDEMDGFESHSDAIDFLRRETKRRWATNSKPDVESLKMDIRDVE